PADSTACAWLKSRRRDIYDPKMAPLGGDFLDLLADPIDRKPLLLKGHQLMAENGAMIFMDSIGAVHLISEHVGRGERKRAAGRPLDQREIEVATAVDRQPRPRERPGIHCAGKRNC